MKRYYGAILVCVTMAIMSLSMTSCGAVDSLLGGSTAGTVTDLWSDVPPLDGATKANLQLPAASRLIIQAVFQGKLEFISYTATRTPQDVQSFYTKERMQASGWNSDAGGCVDASSTGVANAAFCFFGKKEGSKDIGLAIVITQNEQKTQTQIFYARIDVSTTPTPRPT